MRALELSSVTVRRGSRTVLDEVSLRLSGGEILALVGPKGAGKTTLLEAVVGALPLARGSIYVDAAPLHSFAQRSRELAFLSAEGEPASEERVARLVTTAGKRTDAAWAAELRERLGIAANMSRVAGALSRSERRRLLLFEALTAPKPFILLDEPTGVFDPLQLGEVVSVLRAAAERGAGLLIGARQMSDAEALATRIAILNRGRVVSIGTLAELRARARLGASASSQEVFAALLREREREELAHVRA